MQAVSEKLQAALESLRDQCRENVKDTGKRQWMLPPDWDGDPTNLQGLADAFSREESGNAYRDAISLPENGATAADCMARQTEMAYLGMMERAARMRHATIPRAMAHAAITSDAHGSDRGVHTGVVLQHIQNILSRSTLQ